MLSCPNTQLWLHWDRGMKISKMLLPDNGAGSRVENREIKNMWAWQRKWQGGEIILNTGLMLGYNRLEEKDENGKAVYVINEEEAEIVRRIYREFLAGITVTRICRGLEADGIPTKLGKTKWQHNVIKSILTNEK